MIWRFFTGAPYRLGLLALKGNGNGVASVLVGHVHGVQCIIEGVSHRGKHSYYAPCVNCRCWPRPLLPVPPCPGWVGSLGLWQMDG